RQPPARTRATSSAWTEPATRIRTRWRAAPRRAFFCTSAPLPPRRPRFPYTTLFRSGRVEAASDGIGQGATFTVWLPLHDRGAARSEEHTSELQSRENLVCRPLLEKKKRPPRPLAARPALDSTTSPTTPHPPAQWSCQ